MSDFNSKLDFFNAVCGDPFAVNRKDVFHYCDLKDDKGVNFAELRDLLLRIFDQNEKSLVEASDATKGMMGRLNKKSTQRRNRRFFKRINEGYRKDTNKIVLAEGDSWFQFPVFIEDILDNLIYRKENGIIVYSIAYGGDWLANILNEGKYIEEISKLLPDAFLVSGGGNDLVGSSRLAVMVDKNPGYQPKYKTAEDIIEKNEYIHRGNQDLLHNYDPQKVLMAQPYIRKEFYSFLWVLYMQYYLLFKSFEKSPALKNMLVLTQGYDYPIPHRGWRKFDWKHPLQNFVNKATGSSKWLFTPLMLKGFTEKSTRDAILHAFIFEFNLIFMDIVQLPAFPNIFHIDCRGVARSHEDWHDELHLKSAVYEKIADVYEECIQNFGKPGPADGKISLTKKIIRVTDYY